VRVKRALPTIEEVAEIFSFQSHGPKIRGDVKFGYVVVVRIDDDGAAIPELCPGGMT